MKNFLKWFIGAALFVAAPASAQLAAYPHTCMADTAPALVGAGGAGNTPITFVPYDVGVAVYTPFVTTTNLCGSPNFDGFASGWSFNGGRDELTSTGLSVWSPGPGSVGLQKLQTGAATEIVGIPMSISSTSDAYRTRFTVSGISASNVKIYVGGTAGTPRSTNGTFYEDLAPTNTTDGIQIQTTTTFKGIVSNVYVYKIMGNAGGDSLTTGQLPVGRSMALFPRYRYIIGPAYYGFSTPTTIPVATAIANGSFIADALQISDEPRNGAAPVPDSLVVVVFSPGVDTTITRYNWNISVAAGVIYNGVFSSPVKADSVRVYASGATSQIKNRLRFTAWGFRSR